MSMELNKALELLREIRPSIPKEVLELWCKDRDAFLASHPAVEQAGGDERDFQAKGAQEVPSPVSKEYDRHLISLLRKGEALPGHQEEAADEIERLRDWNDHLNNTVLPNILNPNFLMLMKGGERLLDLCTKDGEFIGVSLNDMKDVFDWMVTHARIAPDQAALAQPSPVRSSLLINGYQLRAALDFIAPDGTAEQLKSEACIEWRQQDADFLEAGLYAFCAEYPEEGGVLLDEEPTTAQPSPLQSDQAEAERPEVVAVRYEDGTILSAEECGIALEVCAKVQTPLMTVAQHERIVGALRAENAKLSEALDRWPLIRDSLKLRLADALARVAELEGKLTDWVHEGFRLNEALAVAKAQHSVPDDDMILQIFADNAEHSEQGDEHGYCIVREQHAQAIARKLLAAAPVCRLSRSALTDAQMRRLYDSSTETENERLGFAAFARLIRRAEAVHQIAAAPGKEGV